MSMVYANEIVPDFKIFQKLPDFIQKQLMQNFEKIDAVLEASYPTILSISKNFYEKRYFDYENLINELKTKHFETYCDMVAKIISGEEEDAEISNSCGRICLHSILHFSKDEGITTEFNLSFDIISVFNTIKTEE